MLISMALHRTGAVSKMTLPPSPIPFSKRVQMFLEVIDNVQRGMCPLKDLLIKLLFFVLKKRQSC